MSLLAIYKYKKKNPYFFAMKALLLLLVLSIHFSCSDKPKPPAVQRPTLVPKDSNLVKQDSGNPYAPVDVSPMDVSYFPVDYTVRKMSDGIKEPPVMRIIYSRPYRQGRKIFGSLLKYGEAWRLGANEATEIELFQSINCQGKKIEKGKYILYAVPEQDSWTIVFNSNLNTWGLRPNANFDVHRFTVPIQISRAPVEYFSMVFQQITGGAELVIAWDTVVARLPFQF
ncbi:MAG: DUF2911 domain-containing protein [Bacteroidota bacterium]